LHRNLTEPDIPGKCAQQGRLAGVGMSDYGNAQNMC